MGELSHFDETGASRMVDVGQKPVTRRMAQASAVVRMHPDTLAAITNRQTAKGDVLEVARLAGIQATKRTGELIPLCHPLAIEAVSVDFTSPDDRTIVIAATVHVEAKTGVEMEALTAVTVAALTVYDMCKSIDRSMVIQRVQVEEKSGGRSGHWRRDST